MAVKKQEVHKMTELKPCPFCGGKASLIRYHNIKGGYCYCTVCKTRKPNSLTIEEAIEAWNRRAEDEKSKL